MKFDYLKLANIIKTRRNEKGISTRKLAEKIGISHAEISRFENGLKPSFYLIPFVKMCEELELDIEDLLIEVGLFSEIEDKNQKEAALIVAKFVIENEIIEIDTTIPIEFEVEEIEEEPEKDFEEDDDELDAESFMKMQCENCKHYCPYCGKCSLGE